MVTVKDVSEYIDSFAPYSTRCEWDNCDESKQVGKIGFALDLTAEALNDATDRGADLIITHHPVIFKAKKSFLKGDIAFEAASRGISVLSAHTCFDCAEGGVNDALCEILGIRNAVGVPSEDCSVPMARIGDVEEMSTADFAEMIKEKLNTPCRIVDCENRIKRVAVCGGAGADFLADAVRLGADAYVTGEMDHHELLLAAELGVTTVIAGHFETENPSMTVLKKIISERFSETECFLLKQTNPVKYIY